MAENQEKIIIRKPEGVFVMCLLLFLNFGVYQFYYDFSAMRQSDVQTPMLIAVILISLDVFSAASAIWTFFGDNLARISMLFFVSLNMLWSIFMFILTVAYAQPKADGYYDSNIFLFAIALIKPLLILSICWWYFTKKEVIAYYKQENNNEFF
ncbi:MAG: hypothetical protein MUC29_06850 [Pyrinomonadaceae bacterium]|jgi:hypothetical protein|nr:hypothetical protein [Pyrinomonadaceae bacterium]